MTNDLDPIPMPVPLGLYLAAGGDPRTAFTGDGWEFFCDRVDMLLGLGPDEGDGAVYRQIAQLASERRLPIMREEPRSDLDWVNSVTGSSWEADIRDDPTLIEQLVPFLPENLAARLTDPMAALSYQLECYASALRDDVLQELSEVLDHVLPGLRELYATMPIDDDEPWHAKYPGYRAVIEALYDIAELVEPVKTSSTLEPLEVSA